MEEEIKIYEETVDKWQAADEKITRLEAQLSASQQEAGAFREILDEIRIDVRYHRISKIGDMVVDILARYPQPSPNTDTSHQ